MSFLETYKALAEQVEHLQEWEMIQDIEMSDDALSYHLKVKGPKSSPYEGRVFDVNLEFDVGYPNTPPLIRFKTPLYHCNVYTRDEGDNPRGKLCFRYEAGDIYPVEVIVNLLFCVWEHPNARGPANKAAANLYINNRTEHDRIALEWAKEHATKCP